MERLNLQRFGEETETMETSVGDVTSGETMGTSENGRTDFRQLIAGEYRQDYEKAVGQRIQAAIQQRFKNQQDYKKQLDAVQPILQTLGGRYGLNAEDVAGIAEKLRQERLFWLMSEQALPHGRDFQTPARSCWRAFSPQKRRRVASTATVKTTTLSVVRRAKSPQNRADLRF